MEASVESSVMVVWPKGTKISTPQTRWLSVVLATRRFETLKSSELLFESRRGCYNNDWTGDANNTSEYNALGSQAVYGNRLGL